MIQSENTSSSDLISTQKSILVIEKNPQTRDSIVRGFADNDLRILTAGDGNVGLAIALAKKPDLIITDIMLPGRSGFLIIEFLRSQTELKCPIVVVTSNSGRRHREYAELLGVQDYFLKPFTVSELVSACMKHLVDFVSLEPSLSQA